MSDCECTQDAILSDVLSTDSFHQSEETFVKSSQNVEKLELDFGSVEAGKEKWINISIKNNAQATADNTYIVTRDPDTNPLFQTFGFHTYKLRVQQLATASFRVYYRPRFPGIANVDKFEIIDCYKNVYEYGVRGIGIGPNVQLSASFLRFSAWQDRRVCKQTIELLNKSDVCAVFSIDIDDQAAYFTVDKLYGTIERQSYVYLNITFRPKHFGTYAHDLEIILLNHDPLFVRLFGMYVENPCDITKPSMLDSGYNYTDKIPQLRYMKDVQVCLHEVPLISLSEVCLDFGCLSPSRVRNRATKTMVTSVTNHTQDSIEIRWETDKHFKVLPESAEIESEEATLFECIFTPSTPDLLYGKILCGNVFWPSVPGLEEDVNLNFMPDTIKLRMIGHSFLENTFWIPQVELSPDVIVLPPTIPSQSSFTTFELRSRGFLPTSFRFYGPKDTHFILKPMMGIFKMGKLIMVQLQPDNTADAKVYIEQWYMVMNGENKHRLTFYLKGFAEGPRVVVDKENMVKFLGVQRGCTAKRIVPLRNISQHYINFKFMHDRNDEFKSLVIEPMEGKLAPNESMDMKWSITCNTNIISRKFIDCSLNILSKGNNIVGNSVEIPIEVVVECIFSELCCIPKKIDLGVIKMNSTHEIKFHLYNFGKATIYYELFSRNSESSMHDSNIKCTLSNGTMGAYEKTDVLLVYEANFRGHQEIDVLYHIRQTEDGNEVIPNYEKQVFQLKCVVEIPYMQVVHIIEHNFGPLFSKALLWNLIGIDKLNEYIKNIDIFNNSSISLHLPDYHFGSDWFRIKLLLKNATKFPVEVQLKRRKLCNCNLQEISNTLSLRRLEYSCPHRATFKMELEDECIEADSVLILTINVCYNILGVTIMSYVLKFGEDKSLVLDFHIHALADIQPYISNFKQSFQFDLSPTCLSEMNPFIQCFWLYNNTSQNANYVLDITDFKRHNSFHGFPVYDCLNPRGIITKYSRGALLFKYMPIERQTFNIVLPFVLEDKTYQLEISGKATKEFVGSSQAHIDNTFTNLKSHSIEFSESLVRLDPFPVWNSVSYILFIKNFSKDQVYGYSLQKTGISNLLSVDINQRKGVLKPKESHAIVVEFKAFDKPFHCQIHINCKTLNHTAYHSHRRSLRAYKAKRRELEGQFVITEKGTFYPKNEVQILPFPQLNFIDVTFDVTVTSFEDRDLHYTPIEQMKHMLYENTNVKYLNYLSSPEIDHSAFDDFQVDLFECILSDFVFSNLFREYLLLNEYNTPLYYTQIKTDEPPTNSEATTLNMNPSTVFTGNMFNKLIIDSIHQVFQLGAKINPNYHMGDGLEPASSEDTLL